MTRAVLDIGAIIDEAIKPLVAEMAALRLEVSALREATKPPELLPLSSILVGADGKPISKPAALQRLNRDPELRALGLKCGRELRFRKHEVLGLYEARQREHSGPRAIGDAR